MRGKIILETYYMDKEKIFAMFVGTEENRENFEEKMIKAGKIFHSFSSYPRGKEEFKKLKEFLEMKGCLVCDDSENFVH